MITLDVKNEKEVDMKKNYFLTLSLFLCCSSFVFADTELLTFDPLERNLIFVEGNADIIVPINNCNYSGS